MVVASHGPHIESISLTCRWVVLRCCEALSDAWASAGTQGVVSRMWDVKRLRFHTNMYSTYNIIHDFVPYAHIWYIIYIYIIYICIQNDIVYSVDFPVPFFTQFYCSDPQLLRIRAKAHITCRVSDYFPRLRKYAHEAPKKEPVVTRLDALLSKMVFRGWEGWQPIEN